MFSNRSEFHNNFLARISWISQNLANYLSKSLFLTKWHPICVDFVDSVDCHVKATELNLLWEPANSHADLIHKNVQNVPVPTNISISYINWIDVTIFLNFSSLVRNLTKCYNDFIYGYTRNANAKIVISGRY